MARRLGTPLMPWQRYVVDVALEVLPNGDWAYDEVIVTVERQAGKTTLLRPVVVHRASQADGRRVFLTAQTRKHSRRRWMDATDKLLAAPIMAGKLKRKVSNGFEELRWLHGNSTFEPFAPNEGDMHGETPDLVAIDEWWAFDGETWDVVTAAYEPGFLTKNAQSWQLSTAGTEKSTALNDGRARGRAAVENDVRTGTAYFEWSLPDEVHGIALDELTDEQLLAAVLEHHPANCQDPDCPGPAEDRPCPHGFTLRAASIAAALRRSKNRGEFLRPYGNRSTQSDADRIFGDPLIVASTSTVKIPPGVVPGLAFDVDPDRRCGTISVGWRDPATGQALVEVVEHDLGTRWIAASVVGVAERNGITHVMANNAGPARDVADDVERAGKQADGTVTLEVVRVSGTDYAAACARFHDDLKAAIPRVRHNGALDLVDALKVTTWRPLGGSRAFDTEGAPITPVTSSTLALWAADHPPEVEAPLPRSRIY